MCVYILRSCDSMLAYDINDDYDGIQDDKCQSSVKRDESRRFEREFENVDL